MAKLMNVDILRANITVKYLQIRSAINTCLKHLLSQPWKWEGSLEKFVQAKLLRSLLKLTLSLQQFADKLLKSWLLHEKVHIAHLSRKTIRD